MNMKKFFATTSREALREVKRAIGPDAVILSNRKVEGGVEVLAVAHDEVQALNHSAKASPGTPANTRSADVGAAKPRDADPPGDLAKTLIREIQNMRGTLEAQLGGLKWSEIQNREPERAQLLRDLLGSGFSPALARQLVEKLPYGNRLKMRKWAESALAKNLQAANVDEIVERGGVYALMGPTGVGKTTTTAKLAARCVVRHGASKLALLTTDSYRVGAHEHLRIYGRILGVPVHAVRDADDLKIALGDMRSKHVVLIDTVGMSQRDEQVAEQVAMFAGCGSEVRRLLLLNATCNGQTLEDVARAYRGKGLAGCILTKVDEAVAMGAAIDTAIRHKLAVHFVANGQRVPEDLHPVNKEYLLHRALKNVERSVHALEAADLTTMMTGPAMAY